MWPEQVGPPNWVARSARLGLLVATLKESLAQPLRELTADFCSVRETLLANMSDQEMVRLLLGATVRGITWPELGRTDAATLAARLGGTAHRAVR